MIHSKPAPVGHPIHELIANRWSPLSYSNQPLSPELVQSLLEAARWAPSSFNEQPWSYVVGFQGDAIHAPLADCLKEGNAWAKTAPVLMLSVAKTFFDHNHKPNRHAQHDTGAASALMALQATAMGLAFHQMAGFDSDKARSAFGIGEGFEPMAMIAIGFPGDSNALEGKMKEREEAPRSRKPTEELIWKSK
ncbi:nitroreductase family protein [Candidatus Peregrinibacteria bacterium]|nr:nitroreductase family protein [Candidatus Peregrinibacteria bacterium]